MLLRIGAAEHEMPEGVQKHTLDERLKETMADARVHDLKEQIACAEELLMELSSMQVLDVAKNRHKFLL